eukprot:3937564-Rhodomonas_salina.2
MPIQAAFLRAVSCIWTNLNNYKTTTVRFAGLASASGTSTSTSGDAPLPIVTAGDALGGRGSNGLAGAGHVTWGAVARRRVRVRGRQRVT